MQVKRSSFIINRLFLSRFQAQYKIQDICKLSYSLGKEQEAVSFLSLSYVTLNNEIIGLSLTHSLLSSFPSSLVLPNSCHVVTHSRIRSLPAATFRTELFSLNFGKLTNRQRLGLARHVAKLLLVQAWLPVGLDATARVPSVGVLKADGFSLCRGWYSARLEAWE